MAKTPKKSKRFTYNLASVLKFRTIQETQEQEKLMKAERLYQEEKEKELLLKKAQKKEYAELTSRITAGNEIDFQQVKMRRIHLDIVKEKVVEQVKVREDAEEKKESQRKELVKAVKKRKIMDKDKTKKREAWRKVMDKEDGKFLDELGGISFVRNSRKGS